jgi:general secretion pathway protein B
VSYILEALKKAELQRDIGQVPGIGSEHEKPSRAVTGKWVWMVVVFLGLNLVLLMWLLWSPGSGPDIRNGYDLDLAQPDPVIQEQAVVSAPSAVPPSPVVTPARRVEPEVVLPAAAPVAIEPEPVPDPVSEQPALTERVYEEQVQEFQPAEQEAATDLDSLPVWPQIPGHLFQQIKGGINLDVHVYSDSPQDRFVLINLQKYHAGDQLQEGPLLDEITQEGVILSFQGQQFQVRAQ